MNSNLEIAFTSLQELLDRAEEDGLDTEADTYCQNIENEWIDLVTEEICGTFVKGGGKFYLTLYGLLAVTLITSLIADALYRRKTVSPINRVIDLWGMSTRRSETDDHDNGNMVRSGVIVRGVEVAGEATERVDGITNLRVTENDGARGMEMVFVDMELSKTERIDDDVVHEEGCNNEHVDETGEAVIRCDGTTITRYKLMDER